MSITTFYVVVLILGKVAAVDGPMENATTCNQQAATRFEMIIKKAEEKGIKSVVVDGQTATKKDLSVVCKNTTVAPKVVVDLNNIQQH